MGGSSSANDKGGEGKGAGKVEGVEGAAAAEGATALKKPAPPPAAAPAGRIVWDEAALERLLDRSELEARHAAFGAVQETAGSAAEGETDQDDLLRAFKVRECVWGGRMQAAGLRQFLHEMHHVCGGKCDDF